MSKLQNPAGFSLLQPVQILLALRLLILPISLILLLALAEFPLSNIFFVVIALMLGCCLWSAVVLIKPDFRQASSSGFRELCLDFVWVYAVIMVSGGSSNPFIYYYLVLIALAALILSLRLAWLLTGTAIFLYSYVMWRDSAAHIEHFSSDYRLHLIGMWLNFVISALMITVLISQLMKLLRHQQAALSEAREQNLNNEQLIGLATVAASTVHTLATPLATLNLLSEDIQHEVEDPELKVHLQLMQQQVDRCQTTMKTLSALAQESGVYTDRPLQELFDELREHYSLNHPQTLPQFVFDVPSPVTIRSNGLLQFALINLINNAIEAGTELPTVRFSMAAQQALVIIDNTSALADEDLEERWGKPRESQKQTGLGIGSFLANSTIEKQGGSVQLNVRALGELQKITLTISLRLAA